MDRETIHSIVERQRSYFHTGATLERNVRRENLVKLRKLIMDNEEKLREALGKDLGKSAMESDMCEVRLVESEISYILRHLSSWTRKKRVRTPLPQFHSSSFSQPSPYGVTLIMSPWNYPVLLTLEPLADALAAGNTVVLKGSAYSPATTAAICSLISSAFPPELVACVDGGREENQALLEEKFDYIFFTGSKNVGRLVMKKAAEHLTPVTLELGGKSPVIVDSTADIPLAARRIVFGKFLNSGQTCVAPDYVFVEKSVEKELLDNLVRETVRQFGENPLENPDYGKMISAKHFKRVTGLIEKEKVRLGGVWDDDALRIAPTIMEGVTVEDRIMQEEIFGPVLPVLSYERREDVEKHIRENDTPLAFYIFSKDRAWRKHLVKTIPFGGGCINDTIIHLATSEMGFGGCGESGMGSYHGKTGFDTFTHYKSIVDKKCWIDLPMRYQPYNWKKHRLIQMFLK